MSSSLKRCSLFFFNFTVIINFSIKPKSYKNILNCCQNFYFGKIFPISIMETFVKRQDLHQINNFNNFLKWLQFPHKKQNLLRSTQNSVKQDHKHHFLSQQLIIWIIWLINRLVLNRNRRNVHLCQMTQHHNLPFNKIGKIVKWNSNLETLFDKLLIKKVMKIWWFWNLKNFFVLKAINVTKLALKFWKQAKKWINVNSYQTVGTNWFMMKEMTSLQVFHVFIWNWMERAKYLNSNKKTKK